jgi:lipopolysaccharide transport system permease protein
MIKSLVVRDIRARYVGSFLGLFWSVIHPLSQLAIYYFVFSVILKVKLGPEYGGTHFAVWLLVGLLPWMLFSEVVMRAPSAVLEQANLIKKTVFPSEILPFSHLAAALVNHFIALSVIMSFIVFIGAGLSLKALLLMPYMIGVGISAMGLSWLLSAFNVFLRDIGQIIGVFINIWFYFTPIFYPKSLIPDSLQWLLELNPMLHAVEGYRMGLLGQNPPDIFGLVYLFTVGIFLFVIGGLVFKRLKPAFADVL